MNNEGKGTYYQPPSGEYETTYYNDTKSKRKSKTPIIISVVAIVCILAFVGAIGGGYAVYKYVSDTKEGFEGIVEDSDASMTEVYELPSDGITELDIEWVNGSVDISYHDGDKIIITETGFTVDMEMLCYQEDGTLKIREFDTYYSNVKLLHLKDLEIQIPRKNEINSLDLECVSADVKADELNIKYIDIETVTGKCNLNFKVQPLTISCETVNADITLKMPKEFSGYDIQKESVAGKIICDDDIKCSSNNQKTKIKLESVSGNLYIKQAK